MCRITRRQVEIEGGQGRFPDRLHPVLYTGVVLIESSQGLLREIADRVQAVSDMRGKGSDIC